jgi:proteasome accessory factor B
MASEAGKKWVLESDDQSERLHSLMLALIRTEVGLTKDEIFSSIRGYRLDLEELGGLDPNLSSLNKKFERDKKQLRAMGVDISPVNSSEGDSEYRYRIARDVFVWPKDAHLSASQLQLLELAASVWDQAALSPEANQAITRLRGLADFGSQTESNGLMPRINTFEPSFVSLKTAVSEHRQVSFTYRKADGSVDTRNVQPWQLHHTQGLWILLGFDIDRKEPRNFLLKRIISKISVSQKVFEAPAANDVGLARADLQALLASNQATIKVQPGTTAAMHFETQNSKNGIVNLHYLDLQLLAEELLEFGTAISVVEPPQLREVMNKILEDVTKLYA